MTTPPTGPTTPSGQPISPPKGIGAPSPMPQEQGSILESPFAKMFESVGVTPTAQQIMQIMNNLLKQQILEIKKSDEAWKRAMQKFKEEAIEGQ